MNEFNVCYLLTMAAQRDDYAEYMCEEQLLSKIKQEKKYNSTQLIAGQVCYAVSMYRENNFLQKVEDPKKIDLSFKTSETIQETIQYKRALKFYERLITEGVQVNRTASWVVSWAAIIIFFFAILLEKDSLCFRSFIVFILSIPIYLWARYSIRIEKYEAGRTKVVLSKEYLK